MQYVVLLRGINVGGTSKVPMADLRGHLGESFDDVRTYIASGNIVLTSDGETAEVAETVNDIVRAKFEVTRLVTTLALPADAFREVIAQAPVGFGGRADIYRYDVAFYVGTTRTEVEKHVSVHPEVDTVTYGERAFYHRRLSAKATMSRMSKIASTPVYPNLTVRNWRTTTTLAGMLSG
jgi:uncharacterized protein (DUF1697 family)